MADLRSELGGNLSKACLKWCKKPEFNVDVPNFAPLVAISIEIDDFLY